jgi:hypothetical protein
LPVETVTSLWAALTAEPYSVKPNIAMYDRLIVNLLRRQRFREARERMEEARKLHIKSVYKYGKIVATEKLQSSLFEEGDSERLQLVRGSTAYQNYLSLQRNKTYHHFLQNSSRQYLNRWCQTFIGMAKKNMGIPTFTAVDLPSLVYDFRLFVPRRIEYFIPTGFISFPSGSASLSKRLAFKKEEQIWLPPSTKPAQRALSPPQVMLENDDDDVDDDYMSTDCQLDSEEMFGKS